MQTAPCFMACAVFLAVFAGSPAVGDEGAAPSQSAYDFKLQSIDGGALDLAKWRGHPMLIVNTASFCGFTRQYQGLQAVSFRYEPRGLVVLGVPSNDFSQEPQGEAEIKQFCEGAYGVTFPLAAKVSVRGEGAHPLYKWLAEQAGAPQWNFHKYLIGRDGQVIHAFESAMTPESDILITAIETALAAEPPKATDASAATPAQGPPATPSSADGAASP